MALKYFIEAEAVDVRRVRKEDMRHVAKATGATLVTTFADMEGEEIFDLAHLRSADEVVDERIGDDYTHVLLFHADSGVSGSISMANSRLTEQNKSNAATKNLNKLDVEKHSVSDFLRFG